MTLLEWIGVAVGLLMAVGIGYSLLEWWRERDGPPNDPWPT